MSKFVFTNNLKWSNSLRKTYKNVGFKETMHLDIEENYFTVYKKLNIENENYYIKDGEFIASIGTLFYKGEFGISALQHLLEESRHLSIREVRRNLLGSYAVAIKDKRKVRLFVDEVTSYFLYYYRSTEKYIITNSYYHIQKILNLPINRFEMLEKYSRCVVGAKTPIKDVYKIGGEEILEIDLPTGKINLYPCEMNNYKEYVSSKEDFIDILYKIIDEQSKIRSKNIKRCELFLTGGIDSRLQLASHLKSGDRILTSYWSGQDIITNGTKKDFEISKSLSVKCKCPFTFYDVTHKYEECILELNSERIDKYGEFTAIYGGNKKWFEIFEKNKADSIDLGYGGEILRDLRDLDISYHKNYTIQEFVREVFDRSGIAKKIFELNGFYENLEKKFMEIFPEMTPSNLSKEDCFKLFNYTRLTSDCEINNFINMFTYSFPICLSKPIYDNIQGIPYEWFSDSRIIVSLIEKLEKRLFEVPIYSHHRLFRYSSKNSIIIKSTYFKILDMLKIILADTPIYTKLYVGFIHKYIRPQSSCNDKIFSICQKILENSRLNRKNNIIIKNNGSWKGIDVSALAVITAGIVVEEIISDGEDSGIRKIIEDWREQQCQS